MFRSEECGNVVLQDLAVLIAHSLEAKKILKNFNETENMSHCKGQALLLQARIKECEAASLLLDVQNGTCKATYQEVGVALDILKEHCDEVPPAMKAKVAEMHIVVKMQCLQELSGDSVELAAGIASCLCPFFGSIEVPAFDTANPSIHIALSELLFLVNSGFDIDLENAAMVDDEPQENEKTFRYAAKVGFDNMAVVTQT